MMRDTAKIERPNAYVGDPEDRAIAVDLFDRLRQSAFDGVGITREAYGEKESEALTIIEAKARNLGFCPERDAGANLVITLEGSDPELPFLACGSHLDSVPQGGNFDGAAGVIAGLAILARFRNEGFQPRRTLRLYGLRGEESSRFGRAYMGSSALFGRLSPSELAVRDRNGISLADAMRSVGVDVASVEAGKPLLVSDQVAGWLELHIEQGPVLESRDLPVGIVTGIRGNVRHRTVTCTGEAGHSGAVPKWLRHDAVFATAELISNLDRHWRTMLEQGSDIVVTLGMVATNPHEHALARIPGTIEFSFEVRSQNPETLEAFYALFKAECEAVGQARGVVFSFDRRLETAPAVLDSELRDRLRLAARELGLSGEELASGAGHDAAVFANAGIPSAMIFVRNHNGSHNPKEAMDIDDFLVGAAVLREAIRGAVA